MWPFRRNHNIVDSGVLKGMTDMHSHLLWGVDDGAKSEEQTELIMRKLIDMGVYGSYATPHIMAHLANSEDTLREAFESKLNPIAKRMGFQVQLAAEYMLDEKFAEKLSADFSPLTFDGTQLLVELSSMGAPVAFNEIMFDIQSLGYTPVLAHPERYNYFSLRKLANMKEKGVRFQMNLLSFSEIYGKATMERTHEILKSNLYDFVGTDVHSPRMCDKIMALAATKKTIDRLAALVANNNAIASGKGY